MITYNPIPVLVAIGPVKIYSWGTMLAIGIILGALLSAGIARKKHLEAEHIYDSIFWMIVGGVIGARLLHLIFYPYYYSSFWSFFMLWNGGLVSYGGYAGGIFAFYLYARKKKLNFLKYADVLALGIALAMIITRIGCFLNWDDYGISSNVAWAVKVGTDISRHPTNLYYAVASLAIFILLWQLKDKKTLFKMKVFDGFHFYAFILLYSATRFVIDFWREYEKARWASQVFDILLIIFTGYLMYRQFKKEIKK